MKKIVAGPESFPDSVADRIRAIADAHPAKRAAEKQAARERDEADIRSGRRTAAEVAETNSFVAGLDPAKARIVSRRARIRIPKRET